METIGTMEVERGRRQEVDKDTVKVVDSLQALQSCLMKNQHRHIVFFPRDRKVLDSYESDSLVRSLEPNDSLVSLTLEEVHLSSKGGVLRIACALMSNANFKRLTLYRNKLGDDGVVALMNAIEYSNSIRSFPWTASPCCHRHSKTH